MIKKVELSDGKYTFYESNHILKCHRYGEPWREFTGDNAVHALFDYCIELLEKQEKE